MNKINLKHKNKTAYPITITEAVIDAVTGENVQQQINKKQDSLVSGKTIKTINNQSILGEGNIELSLNTPPSDLLGYITEAELDARKYATQDWVTSKNYLTNHQDISNLALKSELEGLAKETWVNTKIAEAIAGGQDSLDGYATEQWVNEQGFLKEHQDISHLATKAELPTVPTKVSELENDSKFITINDVPGLEIPDDYVTETELNNKGFLTEHQDISHLASINWIEAQKYAKTEDIPSVAGFVKSEDLPNFDEFAKTEDIPSLDNYAELSDLDSKVDKISGKQLSTEDFTTALKQKLDSLSNYDDTELSNSLEQLQSSLDRLMNGNTTAAINSFNEIITFLNGIEDTQSLQGIIASIQKQIDLKQPLIEDLEKIKRGAGLGSTALQEVPSEYITEEELQAMNFATTTQLASKQDVITDLDSIRYNARLGSTAVQFIPTEYITETELSSKNYATKSDVSLKQDIIDDIDSIRTKVNKVDTKQDIIQDLVAIRNNSLSGIAALQQIENLSTVATSGNYSDLNGLPSIRIIPCYGNSINISSASTEITPSITWGEDPSGKVLNAVYTLVIPESSASITPVLQHTVSSPFSWGGELDLIPVQLYNKQTKNWVWATLSVKSAVDKNSSKTVPHIYGISVSSVNAPYPANQNTFNTLSQQGLVDFFGGMPQLHGMVTIQK